MRINSIHVAQPKNNVYQFRNKNVKPNVVAFQGLKTGAWATFGGIIGAGVGTVLTGGALLPALLIGMSGTTAGAIFGSASEENDRKNKKHSWDV